jgi:hypothetical protein
MSNSNSPFAALARKSPARSELSAAELSAIAMAKRIIAAAAKARGEEPPTAAVEGERGDLAAQIILAGRKRRGEI